MEVINTKDFCIPADDASYDELSNFADEIAELATYPIEAEPVRRGRWAIEPGIGCKCTVCGFDIGNDLDFMEYVSYCPNCGAKMEEQE